MKIVYQNLLIVLSLSTGIVLGETSLRGSQRNTTYSLHDDSAVSSRHLQQLYPIEVPDSDAVDPLMRTIRDIPSDAADKGMWSPVESWPVVSVSAAVLPDGRIMTYGSPRGRGAQDGRTLVFWDPQLGFSDGSFVVSPQAEGVDSFCSSGSLMTDGRFLVSGGGGGGTGTKQMESAMVDFKSDSSTRVQDMKGRRWYGAMIKLPDGRVMTSGGSVTITPEIYSPKDGWKFLQGAKSDEHFGRAQSRWWYPRHWVTPVGTVFGISVEKLYEISTSGTGSIRNVGTFKTRASPASRPNVGATSTAVMYEPGKILQVGGNGYTSNDNQPSSDDATIVDINNMNNIRVTETNPMNNPRQWADASVLPDGRVLITGGSRQGNSNGANAVFASELWTPSTGKWQLGASASIFRGYHSTATLLSNGAILKSGGGMPGPVLNFNAEIYYPSYLFEKSGGQSIRASRPRILSMSNNEFNYGTIKLRLELSNPEDVREISFIAVPASTHGFDTNQRRMKLSHRSIGKGVEITMPTSRNIAPPGYYYLSVVNKKGIPSPAVIVSLGSAKPPNPTAKTGFAGQSGELVLNGSFEENQLPAKAYRALPDSQVPGWKSLNGQRIELWASNHRGFPASDGNTMMELDFQGGDTAVDGIYQDIPTAPGKEYILKFDMRARKSQFGSNGERAVVEWNGAKTSNTGYTASAASTWTTHVVRVIGESGLDRLTFRESVTKDGNDGSGPLLDNISLKPSSDLIRNGSFEANQVAARQYVSLPASSVPGWSSLNGRPIELWASNHRGFPASDGNVMLEIDFTGASPLDAIYQDVFTEAGRPYTLKFDVRAREGNPGSQDETIFVEWNEKLTQNGGYKAAARNSWTTHTVRVVGTGGMDRVVFRESSSKSANDGSGPLLDNVSLHPEELIFNGSFEQNKVADKAFVALPDSEVPGWKSLNGQLIELWDSFHNGFAASDGDTMMEMDYVGGAVIDGIYQDLETEAGKSYKITFDMRARRANPAANDDVLVLEWNGVATEYRASAANTWTTHTAIVVGSGGMDRLLFRESAVAGANTGAGPLLDNIDVSVASGNLLINGSFEENSLPAKAYRAFPGSQVPGWNSLNGERIELWASNHRGFPASDGKVMMELDHVGGNAALDGIYQNVNTAAGKSYELSFDMRAREGNPAANGEKVVVEWNGVPTKAGGYRASAANKWTTHKVTVIGTGGGTRLTFRELGSASNGLGPLLDNIQLRGS